VALGRVFKDGGALDWGKNGSRAVKSSRLAMGLFMVVFLMVVRRG
jgi:hypothetical protein